MWELIGIILSLIVGMGVLTGIIYLFVKDTKPSDYPSISTSYKPPPSSQDPGLNESYDQMINRGYARDIRSNTKK